MNSYFNRNCVKGNIVPLLLSSCLQHDIYISTFSSVFPQHLLVKSPSPFSCLKIFICPNKSRLATIIASYIWYETNNRLVMGMEIEKVFSVLKNAMKVIGIGKNLTRTFFGEFSFGRFLCSHLVRSI